MKILLYLLSILALLGGLIVFAEAKSAIHEIFAGVALLGFAVFFSGAGVVDAIERAARTLSPGETKNQEKPEPELYV